MTRRHLSLIVALIVCTILLMPAAWAGDAFVWPVNGEIIEAFIPDKHRGIDISANVGDTVLASKEGVVYWVGRTPRGEPCISIDHPNGLTTTYLPVEAFVSEGQSVSAGDEIGLLSADGDISSEEPHLHFGLFHTATRANKKYLDPAVYLPLNKVIKEPEEIAVAAERVTSETDIGQSSIAQPSGGTPSPTREAAGEAASQKVAISANIAEVPVANNPIQPGTARGPGMVGNTAHSAGRQNAIAPAASAGNQAGHVNEVSGSTYLPPATIDASGLKAVETARPSVSTEVGAENKTWLGTEASLIAKSDKKQEKTAIVSGPEAAPVSTLNLKAAYYDKAGANPFLPAIKENGAANPARQKQIRTGRATNGPLNLAADKILKWRFLPDAISAMIVATIIMIGVQFSRKAGQIGAIAPVEPEYCGAS